MWWILKILKRLFTRKAGSLLGGLGGKELAAVAAALIGAGGSRPHWELQYRRTRPPDRIVDRKRRQSGGER
jgi:hypothetical protein